MKERYNELLELLEDLICNELSFPMGSVNSDMLSICVLEGDRRRLVAMVTENGYTVISAQGEVTHHSSIQDVKSRFLVYFKGMPDCLEQRAHVLGIS